VSQAGCRARYHLLRGAWYRGTRRRGKGLDGPCRRRGPGEEVGLGGGARPLGALRPLRRPGLRDGDIRYLGDRGTAEELVQDVFTSVWKNAGGFDPARASFATWLYRITRNRATDLIRRRNARARTVGNEPLLEPRETDPSGALSRNFDVTAALLRLSPVHRELLVLAYFRGLSQREISERTNTPLGTVKSRTTAALRALRETMGPDETRWSLYE
jgi:RNA polymerase sigma-70 factor, ECF subfamily